MLLLVFLAGIDRGQAQGKPVVSDGVLRFGHQLHKEKGVAVDSCKDCHSLEIDFSVAGVTRGRDHQPCNNSACHASEYSSKTPRICVVCHESSTPWIAQKARLRTLSSSEFSGDFSHAKHVGSTPCKNCHGDVLTGQSKPKAHPQCGSCHQGAVKPGMSDCGTCHSFGVAATQQLTDSRYTVGARFRHATHQVDPRKNTGEAPGCQLCHSAVSKAETLSQLRSPTMQSCDACHDGKTAFKTSGFGCVKCHGNAR